MEVQESWGWGLDMMAVRVRVGVVEVGVRGVGVQRVRQLLLHLVKIVGVTILVGRGGRRIDEIVGVQDASD
jgi:hypothetical protein